MTGIVLTRKGGRRIPHAEPVRCYPARMNGEIVIVRVFAPGASGGSVRLKADLKAASAAIRTEKLSTYEPGWELWSEGEVK